MAETAVSLVIDRLISLLDREKNLLAGVHKDIEDMKDELQSIQSLLKDADLRSENEDIDETIKIWVKQVRDAAYCIEDVVDEYVMHVALSQNRHGVSLFKRPAFLMKKRKIASKIQEIKMRILEIKERRERYLFHSSKQISITCANNVPVSDPRISSHFVEEEAVVGFEATRNELISHLVGGISRRQVVSVVGMGGLGKTTLAKIIYENEIIRKHFEYHAWITVSQLYSKKELLQNLIRQFSKSRKDSVPEAMDKMEEVLLICTLREYLQERRYVVVFDDVWKIEFWGDIEHALLDNNNGSRILITTRIIDVGNFCRRSSFVYVHELQPLPLNEARELLCKKAFPFEGHCPPELEKLSFEIVKKCKGLPLAVVAIGGLLSTKNKIPWEWLTLLNGLSSELECNPHLTNITKILSLSYHDLPSHLKPCCLYFGIFPEDYSIGRPRLTRQWMAEGFVKGQHGKTLEEVANEYLNELSQRNLVQVSWGEFSGVNIRCHIHDLMRDVILAKARDLNFCQPIGDKDLDFDSKSRRISVYNSVDNVTGKMKNFNTRCLFFFGLHKLPRSFVAEVFTSCKLLKVVDFEDTPLDHLPGEVGNLFHLKYLSVSNTKVKRLPKSVGKLQNLQTLNVRNTPLRQLPKEISRLSKLRDLWAKNFNSDIDFSVDSLKGVMIQGGIGHLLELQTLSLVEVNNGIKIVKELGMLTQLRVLSISILTREAGRSLCDSINKMNYLKALDVHLKDQNEILDLQSISNPFQYMFDCFLRGRLEKLPHWVSKLQNIVTIGLFFSRLTDDPLKDLQALPNLEYLYLYEAYNGQQLHILNEGFRKLSLLSLRKLNGLRSVIIDQGSLPLLEQLYIGPSPCLTEVPNDIHHLKGIKTLVFYDMPREFSLRMQPNGGEDYQKVAHIRSVLFSDKMRGEQYRTYRLDDLSRGQ